MTAEERSQIAALTQSLNEFRVQVTGQIAELSGEVKRLCATSRLEIDQLQKQCDERHGLNAKAIEDLEHGDRESYGWQQRLKGMALPIAVCLSILALVLNIVL